MELIREGIAGSRMDNVASGNRDERAVREGRGRRFGNSGIVRMKRNRPLMDSA